MCVANWINMCGKLDGWMIDEFRGSRDAVLWVPCRHVRRSTGPCTCSCLFQDSFCKAWSCTWRFCCCLPRVWTRIGRLSCISCWGSTDRRRRATVWRISPFRFRSRFSALGRGISWWGWSLWIFTVTATSPYLFLDYYELLYSKIVLLYSKVVAAIHKVSRRHCSTGSKLVLI